MLTEQDDVGPVVPGIWVQLATAAVVKYAQMQRATTVRRGRGGRRRGRARAGPGLARNR
ncbi:MAG: hypothetical protein QOK43_2862 [Acidimicrobiaceae bacterium]|nr:hypothetical protein [Acidimicrobiaceae bacterium]